jgi:hypothetical protein
MKITMNPVPLTLTTVVFVSALLTPDLQAADFTGSIGFGSMGASVPGDELATGGSFTLTDPFITTETGVYSGAPLMTTITFNGFQYNPPVPSVTTLWTFSVGAINYSFDATSVTASFNSTLDEWDIGGTGMAMVTGYSATPETWNLNLSQSGNSMVFDSSAAVSEVPEAPAWVLMGGGFVAVAGIVRKLNCQPCGGKRG